MNLAPSDNKLVREFAMKNDKKDEFFHSTSYASAQNEGNIGVASTGLTMAERQAIEEKRKFVKKYNNSKIFESTFGLRHAKKYTPRTEGGQNALFDARSHNRENVVGDANGNVRQSFGRSTGEVRSAGDISAGGSVRSAGQSSGYTPYKTGPSAPSRPSTPSFSAGIKPSFK